ncbi:glycosyltransferase [Actinocrinis puniceicyclus]|uniref:Glycosyltransferase n=1 Tax=Actinocrinis puniceicyclus TaxID=977794 RepID=A0A8J7WU93_9ACTN|nr:glycosyltransferase [Actinocrinis puniceicyclus]MBS2966092.1 glycosyltransferase [Actinocrinis puniceicyclus]
MSSVSVVIPCYRYGHFLEQSVGSALTGQDGIDVKVLIIDDASPDDSADAARRIAKADPRVEVLVHERNKGHLATYNEGLLEWADGDYTVLLSADDRLTPAALVRAAALLDAHPNVGFVYGHPVRFETDRPLPPARTQGRGWSVWPGRWWLEKRFRAGHGCITSPEVVVRTDLQRRLGGYDPRLPHSGDIEMWMRFAAHADVGYLRGVDQAYYRVHSASMSKTDFSGQLDDLRQRKAAYDVVLEHSADALGEADRAGLARTVNRKLARQALYRAARAYDRGRTDQVPVDELVAFAADCWPRYEHLREFAGLSVRRRVGTKAMPYLQPLILSSVVHKTRERLWWRTWRRTGL